MMKKTEHPHHRDYNSRKDKEIFRVYEIFKSDGKKFLLFESEDHFTCEVMASRYQCDSRAVGDGRAYIQIEEIDN